MIRYGLRTAKCTLRSRTFRTKVLDLVVQGTYSPSYRTENSNKPISMRKEENIKKVDFISRNSSLFD